MNIRLKWISWDDREAKNMGNLLRKFVEIEWCQLQRQTMLADGRRVTSSGLLNLYRTQQVLPQTLDIRHEMSELSVHLPVYMDSLVQ